MHLPSANCKYHVLQCLLPQGGTRHFAITIAFEFRIPVFAISVREIRGIFNDSYANTYNCATIAMPHTDLYGIERQRNFDSAWGNLHCCSHWQQTNILHPVHGAITYGNTGATKHAVGGFLYD